MSWTSPYGVLQLVWGSLTNPTADTNSGLHSLTADEYFYHSYSKTEFQFHERRRCYYYYYFFNEPQSLQKRMANVNRLRVVAVSYGTVSTVRQASGPTAPIRVRSLCVPTTRPNPIRCNPLPVEPCRRTISTENNPPAPDTPRPAARAPASVLRPLPNRYDCVVRQKLTTAGDGLEGDGSAVSDLRPHPQGRGGAAVAEREGGGGERTRQQQL